uniref:Uncharacterized protein n=1 Tax=Oryza barthii TaxID=65489 RepID=A0A0D3HP63_9ORYZ
MPRRRTTSMEKFQGGATPRDKMAEQGKDIVGTWEKYVGNRYLRAYYGGNYLVPRAGGVAHVRWQRAQVPEPQGSSSWGHDELERSGHLAGDRFAVRCDVTVMRATELRVEPEPDLRARRRGRR